MSQPDNLIYAYTRKQAIEDGVLVDRSELAREAGIRFPVAVTSALYHEYLVPSEDLLSYGQSTTGRLWDLFMVFRTEARIMPKNESLFTVLFQMKQDVPPEPVSVKAVCGPGDNFEPVITFMLPNED